MLGLIQYEEVRQVQEIATPTELVVEVLGHMRQMAGDPAMVVLGR